MFRGTSASGEPFHVDYSVKNIYMAEDRGRKSIKKAKQEAKQAARTSIAGQGASPKKFRTKVKIKRKS